MRKTMILSIILATALGGSTLALAAPGGQAGGAGFEGGWQHHGQHEGRMFAFRGLNLTDTQKASIKQIIQQSFAQLKPQMQAVRQQRQAFEALSPSASGYQAAAASLAQAEANLTSARITTRAAATAQIYNTVLTSTQQSEFASRKAAFEARKAQWKQFKAEHPVQPGSTGSAQ